MDSHQHEALTKMFYSRRLQPSIPEHDIFINAEIAKLAVLEPKDAQSFAEFYDKVQKSHEDALALEKENEKAQLAAQTKEIQEEQEARKEPKVEEPKEEIVESVEIQEEKEEVIKKPKKKSKQSSPK